MSGKSQELSPAKKRRRVLGEIGNIEEVQTNSQNISTLNLSKDTVSNAVPKDTQDIDTENMPESIPRPIPGKDMNSRGSSIPTLRKNQQYERFLSVNESLNRKMTINSSVKDPLTSAHERAGSRLHESRLALEELTHESERLDYEIEIATKKLNSSEEEAFVVRKLNRALQNENSTLRNAVEEQKSKFDYLSEQITTRVEIKERTLELKLKEKRIKAQSTYEEVKHEIKMELERALLEEKSECAQELALLEKEKIELNKEIAEIDAKNEAKIKAEKEALKTKREKVMAEVSAEISVAEQKLQSLQLRQQEIDEQNLELEAQVALQDEETRSKTNEVALLEQSIQEHISKNAQLQVSLEQATRALEDNEVKKRGALEEEEAAKVLFMETKRKFDSYTRTRRRLEHAISKTSGKNRVLVRVKERDENTETCKVLAQSFLFEKITPYKDDPVYSLEWELLVQEALSGKSVSLLFLGMPQNNMRQHVTDIFSFLRLGQEAVKSGETEYTFYFQNVLIRDGEVPIDLLNSSSEVYISKKNGHEVVASQRMLVKSVAEISQTLQRKVDVSATHIYVFTMAGVDSKSGNSIQGSVTLVDISKLPMLEQCRALRLETNVKSFLQQDLRDNTFLDICDVADFKDPDTESLLTLLNSRVLR